MVRVVQEPADNDNFEQWRAINGLPDGAGKEFEDFDHDGIIDLIEYALGLDPKVPNGTDALLNTTLTGSLLELDFTRPTTIRGVTYKVRASTDLVNWTPLPLTLESATETDETWKAMLSDLPPVFLRVDVERFD